MTKKPLLPPKKTRTFADYFKLNVEIRDLLAGLGYRFAAQELPHAVAPVSSALVKNLHERLTEGASFVNLTNEVARREFLVAPVLLEVVLRTHALISWEYPVEVSPQLKGTFDYYLRTQSNLLVIEAKNADLTKGFQQLAVELIALDQWLDRRAPVLHGAVTTGDSWRFGLLQRRRKLVMQDTRLISVPDQLAELLGILTGILAPERAKKTASNGRASTPLKSRRR